MTFAVDQVVVVTARTGVGENKPGGVGRITQVSESCVDVKYVLGGRERGVALEYVAPYASGEQRAKRTIHGRCRRCGCLVVDCLHAQPDAETSGDDAARRKALARRQKLARSWQKALTGRAVAPAEDEPADSSSSSSSSSSENESEEEEEEDMPATQPVTESDEESRTTARKRSTKNAIETAIESDDDDMMPATQPLVETHDALPATQPVIEIDDDEDNEIPGSRPPTESDEIGAAAVDDTSSSEEGSAFIAAEDDGESMPADLAALAPPRGASNRSLRRRMERLQRFVQVRGLRHARDEVAGLRVRAVQVEEAEDLDALERAAANVRAFLLRGLRRRGVDVADACYRRLASRGARAGLGAAARKQDLLDDALRDLETDLDAVVELARSRCVETDLGAPDDDGDDGDAKLHDIWRWELPGRRRRKQARKRRGPTASVRQPVERPKRRRRRREPAERVGVDAATIAALYGARSARFGEWVAEDESIDDDEEAVSLLRRLIDDAATIPEGIGEAVELLRTCWLSRAPWTKLMASSAAALDAAERIAGHRRDLVARVDELRLWLLGRAAAGGTEGSREAWDALARCIARVTARDEARWATTELTGRAWRTAATLPAEELWRAVADSATDRVSRCRVLVAAARALTAEPTKGDDYLVKIWKAVDLADLDVALACRLATAVCAASRTSDDATLWRLWDAAVAAQTPESTRLAIVAPTARYFTRAPASTPLRAATEMVVCFAAARPSGVKRRRLVLDLVRRRALPAVAANPAARRLVLSCLVSLADDRLVEVDADFVRAASAADRTGPDDDDSVLAARTLAKFAPRHAAPWLARLAATSPVAADALVDVFGAARGADEDLSAAAALALVAALKRTDGTLAVAALSLALAAEADRLAPVFRPVHEAAEAFLGDEASHCDALAPALLDAALLVGSKDRRTRDFLRSRPEPVRAELLRRQERHSAWAAPIIPDQQ